MAVSRRASSTAKCGPTFPLARPETIAATGKRSGAPNRQHGSGPKIPTGKGTSRCATGNRLQKRDHITESLGHLARFKPDHKPILLIEYGTKPAIVEHSIAGAKENGFVLLVTDRNLKTFGRCENFSEP